MSIITFTPVLDIDENFYPVAAIKELPQWYVKMNQYSNNKIFKVIGGNTNSTAKKCVPLFDAMSSGYFLKTHVDIFINRDESGSPSMFWPQHTPISTHPRWQAENYPNAPKNNNDFFKWENPWAIKTNKGYSCLFVSPMHRDSPFELLPGVVDTDKYIAPVGMPFILKNDVNGLIPAGTIFCQVIPFRRDEFKMKISHDAEKTFKFIRLFKNRWVNNYRNNFWTKKRYR